MTGKTPANDNRRTPAKHRNTGHRRANFSWKINYYPGGLPVLAEPEAAKVRQLRPLRVLTLELEERESD
jgi:hypothetical protein